MSDTSAHPDAALDPAETRDLAPVRGVIRLTGLVGCVALIVAIVLTPQDDAAAKRFFFAYLTGYAFVLSIALGAMFFVLIQHVTSAGWSVTVRRVAEVLAAGMPMLAILAIPIIWGMPHLYPAIGDDQMHFGPIKTAYLSRAGLIVRLTLYFIIWIWMARAYWRRSVKQDDTGDVALSLGMRRYSGPAIVIYALTLTFASFDLLMALDPHWFSTIFGVYFFGGAVVASMATMILIFAGLQSRGVLTMSVNTEHYHDLGKLMFGFVFFWGYIAFSQYMLIWYASIPEEVVWLRDRGATTVEADMNGWSRVIVALMVGHFMLPFLGLMSRHVKRRLGALSFWCVWLLIFHYLDLCWLVMPSYTDSLSGADVVMMVLCLVGIGGIFTAACGGLARGRSLVPEKDPRLHEALKFHNT